MNSLRRNAFHFHPRRIDAVNAFLISSGALRTRRANSEAIAMNSVKDATWNANPAIMILTPVSLRSFWSESAMDVMAPPAAWRIKAIKSQVTKMIVYVRGRILEMFSP
jgi:hypothetical protein